MMDAVIIARGRGRVSRRLSDRRRRGAARRERRVSKRTSTPAKRRSQRSPRGTARARGAARATPAERDALWAGRKGAAGATGRIAPELLHARRLRAAQQAAAGAARGRSGRARDTGSSVGNVFHAGDGNLHPLLMYDKRDRRQVGRRRRDRQRDPAGGDRTGRHDQRRARHRLGEARRDDARLFDRRSWRRWRRVRDVFDPRASLNPEKIFPERRALPRSHAAVSTARAPVAAPARRRELARARRALRPRGRRAIAIAGGNTLGGMGFPPERADVDAARRTRARPGSWPTSAPT